MNVTFRGMGSLRNLSLLVSDEKVRKDLGHVDDPARVVDEDRRQPTFDVRFVDDGLQVVKHRP